MTAQLQAVPRQSEPTSDELIDRARALGPLLSLNALKSEQDRRAHQDNIDAISEAGLFRLMVPKRFGGYQQSLRTHLDVTAALAESCAGTAWVTALTNVCAWFVGLYPKRAQEDVFGANPNARVAGVFTPSKDCRRVEGGLVVSGKWFWSSGSLHADWVTVGVMEHDKNGAYVGQYLALLPRSDITIDDTWFTVGMRASGSNCVVAKDVFVPDHRLLDIRAAVASDYPTEFKDEAEYRGPFVPVAALVLVGAQLGIGRAALKYVIEKASQRNIAYTTFEKQTSSVMFQAQIAEAALKIDTAHLHAYRAAADIDDAAQRGEKLDYLTRARVRADSGVVVTNITDAINILVSAHGAGTFAEGSPLQRMWRDSNTAARHAVVLPAVGIEVYGKALLGVENTVTPLV
ncbi:acyl-CoA dehydrogenase family protein [Burkholderia sp. PAMC 26561]|uniref:acyl-CoA dehydrogenase family protein n=1 Tax=Burkholderia sp. PAMC 26561 TaxID=1795043 RepID=UPI00076B6CF5|nr:acyl-CoA dehydrogenase family protein [Burkholderia sp. PAMC 26561]AME27140.1 oxidoreductase [Burkholderia sp. PAMC 26561]AME27711.1 oxidoreductase [Burkholderia sp. PAMC 26561]